MFKKWLWKTKPHSRYKVTKEFEVCEVSKDNHTNKKNSQTSTNSWLNCLKCPPYKYTKSQPTEKTCPFPYINPIYLLSLKLIQFLIFFSLFLSNCYIHGAQTHDLKIKRCKLCLTEPARHPETYPALTKKIIRHKKKQEKIQHTDMRQSNQKKQTQI